MFIRLSAYLVFLILLCSGSNAQGLSQDLIKTCQMYNDAAYVSMDVEVAVYSSHTSVAPASSLKGKVVRGSGYYYIENGFLSMCRYGNDMVLINSFEKTVSYRYMDPKEGKASNKGMETFDLVSTIKQMDSLVSRLGKTHILPSPENQTSYRIDFSQGLYKSISVVFKNGFISSMTYIYNSEAMSTNNKIIVSYKNVSFEQSKAIIPFRPQDIVSFSEKEKSVLAPKYSHYELIIVKDDMQ